MIGRASACAAFLVAVTGTVPTTTAAEEHELFAFAGGRPSVKLRLQVEFGSQALAAREAQFRRQHPRRRQPGAGVDPALGDRPPERNRKLPRHRHRAGAIQMRGPQGACGGRHDG